MKCRFRFRRRPAASMEHNGKIKQLRLFVPK